MRKRLRRNKVTVWTEIDIDVDIADVINEIDDETLVKECIDRGLFSRSNSIEAANTKRHLCDIAEVSYHTDNNKLIELIKEKL